LIEGPDLIAHGYIDDYRGESDVTANECGEHCDNDKRKNAGGAK